MDSNLALIAELPARLGWTLAYDTLYADPPWLKARFIPSFPECNPEISETSIVFDLLELFRSAQRPGGYFLLNCTCGYALDADIKDLVFVSHPNANTVIWELDVHGLGPALEDYWAWHNGFLRLIFKREEYEADLCAMLRDLRSAGSPNLPVEDLEPDIRGEAYERAMALREDELCLREPVLPAGTALEFGLSGSDLLVIDGKPDGGWPDRLFTRWFAHAAFKQWISYVCRGFWVRHELAENNSGADLSWFNEPEQMGVFFLLRESERTDCDEAGAALVRCLKACYAEGVTAPGVEISYRACPHPAVLSEATQL